MGVLARQDGEQSALLVLVAEVPVEPPPLSDEHLLPVPTESRRRLESALEDVANAFAVFFMARRSISSVMPCVAFVPYDEEARRFTSDAAGIDIGGGIAVPEALSFDAGADDFRLLDDRRDGAALLAEALATAHAVSQFREYMRLFERAFALGPHDLIRPLTDFLSQSSFSYSEAEVERWFNKLRHEAVHADRRPTYALEADVRYPLRRVRQAAFDVVFNKMVWRNRSSTRRDGVDLHSGISDDHTLVIRQHSSGAIRSQLFDPFGSYPVNLHVNTPIPDGWLVTTGPYNMSSVNLEVQPETAPAVELRIDEENGPS